MKIILITILLTLLGAGLVILLVWLSVVSWKSIKYKKNSQSDFMDLHKRIDEEIKTRDKSTNMLYDQLDKDKDDVNKKIEEIYRDSITDIWRKFDEVDENVKSRFETLGRNIDSRFDKIHNLLNEKNPDKNNK